MALTDKQLEVRRSGVGASEIAAILGIGKYEGPLEVFNRKVGSGDEFVGNRFTFWGSRLEPVIADAYEDLFMQGTGKRLLMPHDIPDTESYKQIADGTFRRTDRPYLLCTPDRAYSDLSRLVEIKTASYSSGSRDWGGKDGTSVPIDYLCQVRYQMLFFGIKAAHLVPLIGGNDIRVYDILYRDDWTERILIRVEEFWLWVEKGIPNPEWAPKPRTEWAKGVSFIPATYSEAHETIFRIE